MADVPRLVLASGSRSRRQILSAAGIVFEAIPADLDETALRESSTADGGGADPGAAAGLLAEAKALAVSMAHPGAIVIGGDQILALEGRIFEKPEGMDGARAHLLDLRGKSHSLHAGVALARNGAAIWRHTETARLTMRNFSDGYLEDYLERAGPVICESVGAYQLEGLGVGLFESIEGDYFTILGLPLLPLMRKLRALGVLPA